MHDDEYRIEDVYENWLTCAFFPSQFPSQLHYPEKERIGKERIGKALLEYELSLELDSVYLDPQILNTITQLNPKRIIIVSDYYCDKHFIKSILDRILAEAISTEPTVATHPLNAVTTEHIAVSCELKVNKRSGKLFEKVQQLYNLSKTSWLHLGDHRHSDHAIPLQLGIQASLYLPEQEHKAREQREALFYSALSASRENSKKDAAALIQSFQSSNYHDGGKYFFDLGYRVSPAFFAFASWIIEKAKVEASSSSMLAFFTREGFFFQRLVETLFKDELHSLYNNRIALLDVSRVATFGATLRSITTDELMRLWAQYSKCSFQSLFKSLNVKATPYIGMIENAGFAIDEVIEYPWQNGQVKRIFRDRFFIQRLKQDLDQSRHNLLAYLNQQGLDNNIDKLLIVDIGWRGSIQDNVCHLLPNTYIRGLYLGLQKFLLPQLRNSQKDGYLFNDNIGEPGFHPISPIEILCNSLEGSVCSHGYSEDNGLCFVNRQLVPGEFKIHLDYVMDFQSGVLSGVRQQKELGWHRVYTSQELRPEAQKIIKGLVAYPPPELIKAYTELAHNESFGEGSVFTPKTFFKKKPATPAFSLSREHTSELIKTAKESRWPQSYLEMHAPWLTPLYNYSQGIEEAASPLVSELGGALGLKPKKK